VKNHWWFQIVCLLFLVFAILYVRVIPVDGSIAADCPIGYTPTYTIQGAGDSSPLDGQTVTTCGVVGF
jgi:hypothetical protein